MYSWSRIYAPQLFRRGVDQHKKRGRTIIKIKFRIKLKLYHSQTVYASNVVVDFTKSFMDARQENECRCGFSS